MIVQVMPGADHMIAAHYNYRKTKPDLFRLRAQLPGGPFDDEGSALKAVNKAQK